ncbi:hypothetical protein HYW21_06610 [Candidatus Woesearchaeota archaeon]|nr:hypothetical protein [Candidatus Woesearchaeota archaeon]
MQKQQKAWVISVDMGYGHQRAAYPFRTIAYERIITANSDKIVTPQEQKQWKRFQRFYEGISRLASLPHIGKWLFALYDALQSISPYYPFRDLSKPNFGSIYMHVLIRKHFLSSTLAYTQQRQLPMLSTFFAPALAAAHLHRENVFCVVTDADINRIWVPEDPKKEQLSYCTPTEHSAKRLEAYGVRPEHIFYTGFPLPEENVGKNLHILKHDLGERLINLDPRRIFRSRYKETIVKQLGMYARPTKRHPLTITFVVGGAGAQKELGVNILYGLRSLVQNTTLHLHIVVGTRLELAAYYTQMIKELHLHPHLGKNIFVHCYLDKKTHFQSFNELLHTTDILWTKPSELSFYTALGIPLIMTPALGAHEVYNQQWLMHIGGGIPQESPTFASEWLMEWIQKGILAKAAWQGYMEAPKYGTTNIKKLLFAKQKQAIRFRY